MTTTKEILAGYYAGLKQKAGWQDFIAEKISFTSPGRTVNDKDSYVQVTAGFLSMVTGININNLIIDGDAACAVVEYELISPSGNHFKTPVPEILTISQGKIAAMSIYFDTQAFGEFIAGG